MKRKILGGALIVVLTPLGFAGTASAHPVQPPSKTLDVVVAALTPHVNAGHTHGLECAEDVSPAIDDLQQTVTVQCPVAEGD